MENEPDNELDETTETPDVTIEEMNIEHQQPAPDEGSSAHDHPHSHEEYERRLSELEAERARLDEICRNLDARISELHATVRAKREKGPTEQHLWFKPIGKHD